ncbi:MAG: four helix bundle protein [Kiritimatiellae bacterium]|nr:four helix bundle protein [Kiritimatiellia bacterium]MDD5521071.1 four helix bundle protein [Kiritimatiellia bacterium]
MSATQFDHEKLRVYIESLGFLSWLEGLFTRVPSKLSVRDQLDRASTSIPLNIAEGNGKYTEKDRCKYFDNARGSALECAACLDVLVTKKILKDRDILQGKEILTGIVSMLVGLIKNNSSSRVYESQEDYGNNGKKD